MGNTTSGAPENTLEQDEFTRQLSRLDKEFRRQTIDGEPQDSENDEPDVGPEEDDDDGGQHSSSAFSFRSLVSQFITDLRNEHITKIGVKYGSKFFSSPTVQGILNDPRVKNQFSEESVETAQTIFNTLIRYTGPLTDVSPFELFNSVRALYMLQRAVRSTPEPLEDHRVVRDADFEDMKYYMPYSVAAYGHLLPKMLGIVPVQGEDWEDKAAIRRLTGIDVDVDLVSMDFGGDVFHPGYFIALDRKKKEVIVSVRGTYILSMSQKDIITDSVMEDVPFTCRVPLDDQGRRKSRRTIRSWRAKSRRRASQRSVQSSAEVERRRLLEEQFAVDEDDDEAKFGRRLSSTISHNVAAYLKQAMAYSASMAQQGLSTVSKSMKMPQGLDEDERVTSTELRATNLGFDPPIDGNGDGDYGSSFERIVEHETQGRFVEMTGRTHSGWLKAAENLDKKIADTVRFIMCENPGYRLVLTGHSMGATIATLLTLKWVEQEDFRSARCYGFACPGTLPLAMSRHPLIQERVFSMTLGNDVVSRFGLPNLMDLRQTLLRLTKPRGDVADDARSLSQVILANELAPQEMEEVMELLEREEMVHDKLYPAGTLWYIMPYGVDKDSDGILIDQAYLGEMLLTLDMFTSHFGSLITMSRLGGVDIHRVVKYLGI